MLSKAKNKEVSISEVLSFPNRIQNTLILYYLFPVLLIFTLLSSYFYISSKNSLDEEFGKRLTSIAQMSVAQVKPIQFLSLRTTGVQGKTYQLIQNRFKEIARNHEIDRIYILDLQSSFLLDSTSNENFGNPFERYNLHATEIQNAFGGKSADSTLFKGRNDQFYKTAFSPILDHGGNVIAIIGVDGNATFFQNLKKIEKRLFVAGIFFILLILAISYTLSRKIVVPIELLALAAKRIGDGQIEKEINIKSKNEVGFLSYVMDEMRKKILERDQSMQVMLRGIAHEVRNPLGGIELFGGMLKEKIKDEDSQKDINKILQETDNLKKLVDEFLNFAKKPAIQLETCDLQDFLEDIAFHWNSKLRENNISFTHDIKGASSIRWDLEQMRRVFHNLIENSIQSITEDPKDISINISSQRNHSIFEIKDSGCGISNQNQENLFKPFFTTKTFGNGLGLAIVQKVVQAHGGDIEIKSQEGHGTVVSMIFPNQIK